MSSKLAVLIVIASFIFGGSARADTNFLAGADFSHLKYFESLGAHYKEGGQIHDAFQIIKNHGLNCVRLRLFTSSQAQASADPYNYINNTNYTVPLAVRVKNAGLLFCLDFHYSDTWADPGKQQIPDAWTNLNFTQLEQQLRAYNSNTIATFAAAGAMPDYVQVGNEITGGMLWPLGKVSSGSNTPTQWSRLGQLMTNAIQGVRDASGASMPKIIIHIDRGGDWNTTKTYFDHVNAQGVPYDIIGESYYTFYHGDPTNLNICLSNAAVRYGKPIVVAETAFPWNNSVPAWTNKLYGFAPSLDGQVSFIAALAKMVESMTNHLGAGVFYWGTEYQPGGGGSDFNNSSFWDYGGNVLPVADSFGGMRAPLVIKACSAGSNLRLWWPFSGAASTLLASTSLSPSVVWSLVADPPQITGTVFTVTLPLTDNSRFYRLQSD
jgi:arabinogalactan endo-1,4-beta-galactosidase